MGCQVLIIRSNVKTWHLLCAAQQDTRALRGTRDDPIGYRNGLHPAKEDSNLISQHTQNGPYLAGLVSARTYNQDWLIRR